MGRFRFIDDVAVADCALELHGADLDDLFATAARALAEVMVDPATVGSNVRRTVSLTAPSLDVLLFDWLAELIYLKDASRLIFPDALVRIVPGPPCQLDAVLIGGGIETGRTALRADPKAPTFHLFTLTRDVGGWRACVVIDI